MKKSRINIAADAERAFMTLQGGGIAILPMDVGYSLIGGSGPALEKIFDTKQRAPTKFNAMLGNTETTRELHILTLEQRDMVEAITIDHDLPLGLIAPARMDHPLLRKLDEDGLRRSVHQNTVCMLLNAGPFHEEICRLSLERLLPLFGSSANRTLKGTKFRTEDIETEICAIADCVIDYGLCKYHLYKASSTLINISTMSVIRYGSCFELISTVLNRYFDVKLPDPHDF